MNPESKKSFPIARWIAQSDNRDLMEEYLIHGIEHEANVIIVGESDTRFQVFQDWILSQSSFEDVFRGIGLHRMAQAGLAPIPFVRTVNILSNEESQRSSYLSSHWGSDASSVSIDDLDDEAIPEFVHCCHSMLGCVATIAGRDGEQSVQHFSSVCLNDAKFGEFFRRKNWPEYFSQSIVWIVELAERSGATVIQKISTLIDHKGQVTIHPLVELDSSSGSYRFSERQYTRWPRPVPLKFTYREATRI